MSFLKRLILIAIIIVVSLLVAGSFLSTRYTVVRTTVISSNPEQIHAYVGDLERWPEWEPWTEGDPTMIVTLGDKTRGIGASQSWNGDSGSGHLIFTKDSETDGIEYNLSFEGGRYYSEASLKYQPLNASSTRLEWSMSGDTEIPLIGGYFALFIKSVTGPLFEKGLKQLKEKVEG